MPEDRPRWFGPHRRGFGWGPVAWQGWIVAAMVVVVVLVAVRTIVGR